MQMEKKTNIKVVRTREATLFEIATAFLLCCLWLYVLMLCLGKPQSVVSGLHILPDVRTKVILAASASTVVSLLCLVAAYHPASMINAPFKIVKVRQYVPLMRLMRVLAVTFAAMSIAILRRLVDDGDQLHWGELLFALTKLVTFVAIVYYGVRSWMLRK